ncbi:MAG: dicarboxylate/amino acid:cation symporter [Rhabdochlamydiaceae bacterium]
MHKNKKKSPLPVFIAIALAILCGSFTNPQSSLCGVNIYNLYDLLGTLFIKALMLIVVPLVASAIITGIAKIGQEGGFGRLGLRTFLFYVSTSLSAILIGLILVNIFKPGISEKITFEIKKAQALNPINVEQHLSHINIKDIILSIVPSNVLEAFSNGQMLSLIFFSLLFGYALSKIDKKLSQQLLDLWQAIFNTMITITHIIMKVLPLGVFCLVAKVFSTTGLESLVPLIWFVISVISGLCTFTFVGLPLFLKFVAKVDPFLHFKAMAPALITAFSTSSSSATLPITMECVEKRAGVSNRICSLVVPLGTTINMSGSALYECVAAMFVAQAYGLELSFVLQFLVVFLALLTSMGVAGVPSGSLVSIIVILKAIGLPAEGIGLFIAVDRILDMCRTTVNVFSDSCCAVLVAKAEGEKDVLTNKHMTEI